MSLRVWICLFIVGLALAGCEAESPQTLDNPADGVVQEVRQAPQDVLDGFMKAWSEGNKKAMYGFVSEGSRAVYPSDVFEKRYEVAEEAIGFTGVSYTLDSVKIQGTTAIVTYDAAITSSLLSELKDPSRIMRLTQVQNGWQIAWTPMDILSGLTSDVRIDVPSRFPPRGSIYDRNGEYIVEEGGTIVSVSIIQQDTRDVEECIDLLAHVLKWEHNDMATLFSQYNPESLFFVGEIDVATYTRNRTDLEEICGVANESSGYPKIESYSGRSYVGHGSAAHITGSFGRIPVDQLSLWQAKGYQSTDLIGISGIENKYQETLAGKPERYVRLVESGGALIRELGGTEGKPGTPLQLTIDMNMQNVVAQALIDAHNYAANNWATKANGAAVVVMKVDTGEILALASYPFYDPSIFNPESSYFSVGDATNMISALVNDSRQPLRNHAVEDQYTPGSVYKIFTEVAAANKNIFPPDELFPCELTWTGTEWGDEVEMRQDWRVVDEMPAAGDITMSQALTTSCNPFFWQMGALMYQQNTMMHIDYVKEFGFGSPTGLSILGNEARGNLAEPQSATEAINNAIGQGSVQITAVQLATAVTAIANKGTLYRPFIIKQVGGFDDTKKIEEYEPIIVNELDDIKPEVFDIVHAGMCDVPVNKELGTSYLIFNGSPVFPSYTSCGKTGTAETGDVDSGRPPNAWYASFAPADKPEIVVVVVVPTSREGSEVAAPIARRIYDDYFKAKESPFPEWWFNLPYIPVKPPVGVAVDA